MTPAARRTGRKESMAKPKRPKSRHTSEALEPSQPAGPAVPSDARGHGGAVVLSRWQLDLFVKCPRCFWLLKRHGIKLPKSYPLALNLAMDALLKTEFDACRAAGRSHPVLLEAGVTARLFRDMEKLSAWRHNFRGLRWKQPKTGHTLFGAIDDVLEFPDGSLAVLDFKASGAAAATIYPDYQLQMDVYTFLLQRLGYRTAPKAFFAFFLAVKDGAFEGRLPFRPQVVEVTPQPERVPALFEQAIALAQAEQPPEPGPACDLCRWSGEAASRLPVSARSRAVGAPPGTYVQVEFEAPPSP